LAFLKNITKKFFPEEIIAVIFSVIILIFQFIYYFNGGIESFSTILTPLLSFFILSSYIIIFNKSRNKVLLFIRSYIQIPYYGIIFTAYQGFIHHLVPHDFDALLHRLDLSLFRFDATVWLEKFNSRFLTEMLTICYFSYYLLPTLTAVLFYFVKSQNNSYIRVRNLLLAMLIGWYGAFILYSILPAAGPNIAFPQNYHLPLIGLSSFTGLYLQSVESYLRTSFVRNTFPSMHFAILLIINYFSFSWSKKYFYFCTLPLAIGLATATLYLRQHYLIDLAGSVIVAYLSIRLAFYINKSLPRFQA
jgi:membrane-associated phospholipid phosphatase